MNNDVCKAKLFYSLMCWAGLLIILLPVGIANLIFGYMLGDSPCALCWGQREAMIFIGVIALFIVRYGLKPRYLASLLIVTAFGLYQSFAHYGLHAGRDLDQGFALPIFGIHTYFWAEIVFWFVVVLLGVMFFFAPRLGALDEELKGEKYRKFTSFSLASFVLCGFIIASNVLQAFISTGVPPFAGQSNPIRFSFNPKYAIWSADYWKTTWHDFSFLGKRDVKSPDYAFAPATKIGVVFDHISEHSPFAKIDKKLQIVGSVDIDVKAPLNSLNYIYGEYVASSKFDVYFLNKDFKVQEEMQVDPYFANTIDPIVGIVPYMGDKYLLMGSNKSFLRFAKNPNADEVKQYADFIRGADRFEGQGEGLGRGRLETVRSKFHHVMSIIDDGDYFYLATVPNNRDKKTFVISKFSFKDRMLSGEFVPQAKLKQDRTLGELYVTAMAQKDGLIYALSKNYNLIVVIDPKKEEVVQTLSFPDVITNARAILLENGISILSYENGINKLYELK